MDLYTQVPSLKEPLRKQILAIRRKMCEQLPVQVLGVILIGSCARGRATYRSDIDLLIVISSDQINADQARGGSVAFETQLAGLNTPLPIQFIFVGQNVFKTQEPAMVGNLRDGIILTDPNGFVAKGLEALRRITI